MHGRIGTGVRAFRRLGALTPLGGLLALLSASTWAAPVARAEVGTFGKTSIGGSKEVLAANRKRVNEYPLSAAGAISQLSVYLQPSTVSGQQQIEGVIYADSNGAPGGLLAVSQQLAFESTQPAGWYPLVFPVAVELPAGNYWIGVLSGNSWGVAGFRYDTVPASKAFNHNNYTAGPSNPFGAFSTDGQQMSLYATYGPPRSSVPANTSSPTISGTAEQGQTLTERNGEWTNSPTSYAYQWQRCDASGNNCAVISGAMAQTYVPTASDVGHTIRVQETASNAGGSGSPAQSAPTAAVLSAPPASTSPPTIAGEARQGQTLTEHNGEWTNGPTSYAYQWQRCDASGNNCTAISGANTQTYATTEADVGHRLRVLETASNAAGPGNPVQSAPTAVVTASSGGVSHLEYVLQDGTTSVYDMDHEFKLVKTISMPQDKNEVRGVSVAPATHIMYVIHGGDGPTTTGSVLAWDLVQEKVLWDVKLTTGIDSGQVSPDATKLYVPTGELDPSGIWNILSAANGELLGTVHGGSGAHNTVVSNDGQYVYLGGRRSNVLRIYETSSGKIKEIGPLAGSVRPLTANGKNTLVFTTATGFDGFQVSSVTASRVLFTVSFGEVPRGFQFTGPSHGISLSPDEKRVYVVDAVHKQVQVWDVSKVAEGTAPTRVGVVPVAGWTGTESPCVYDCGRGGWLQTSLDGRYLLAGDSGEVIDTSTLKVITTLSTLAQTKKSIEVDWQNGVPIATSGRTGVGYVK